ncbi:MAG: SIR2 family protein [Dysgonamonadaceae bacterium]|jgi:hypothetical protein|nr:SIR2 family protein [Dysgonamonadaceae bacterium]
MKAEFEPFIKDFVRDLHDNNVAIFAGAGMSKPAGFVNWKELLTDIATDLHLDIEKESDLISLAQFHVTENNNRHKINQKILDEFTEGSSPTENHDILSRLPITTFWTTNYDTLIEKSLENNKKRVAKKFKETHLSNSIYKKDCTVYKMHGDVSEPDDAVITKEDYEKYDSTRGLFTSALNGELITKTFLFIGFSFSDPNINYILSRLNNRVNKNASRQHYCFIKKPQIGHEGINNQAELGYANTKQALIVNDLKRYKIKSLLIDNYDEITEILREIEKRYNKQTIFISGSSCGEYGRFSSNEAQEFIHNLSKQIVLEGFTVVNGFGLGVGSAVINGALDAIDTKPQQCSDDQLIMKPFPQFATNGKTIPELWNAYRRRIIPLAGIAIFIFGNKKDSSNNTILADGVEKEFNIAIENGLIPIPIAITRYIAKVIYDRIIADSSEFLQGHDWILNELNKMNEDSISQEDIIKTIINIIKKLNK